MNDAYRESLTFKDQKEFCGNQNPSHAEWIKCILSPAHSGLHRAYYLIVPYHGCTDAARLEWE